MLNLRPTKLNCSGLGLGMDGGAKGSSFSAFSLGPLPAVPTQHNLSFIWVAAAPMGDFRCINTLSRSFPAARVAIACQKQTPG